MFTRWQNYLTMHFCSPVVKQCTILSVCKTCVFLCDLSALYLNGTLIVSNHAFFTNIMSMYHYMFLENRCLAFSDMNVTPLVILLNIEVFTPSILVVIWTCSLVNIFVWRSLHTLQWTSLVKILKNGIIDWRLWALYKVLDTLPNSLSETFTCFATGRSSSRSLLSSYLYWGLCI